MLIRLNNGETIFLPDSEIKYELAKMIVEARKELGHSLTFEEAKRMPKMPENPNIYAYYFGSFEVACKDATGVIARRDNPDCYRMNQRWEMEKREEILNRILEISFQEHGNDTSWISETTIKQDSVLAYTDVLKTFGGIRQLRTVAKQLIKEQKHGKKKPKEQKKKVEVEKMAGSVEKWSHEMVIKIVRDYYNENGQLPKDAWFSKREGVPSIMTVRKHLGNSKEEWLKAIGVSGLVAETTSDVPEVAETPVVSEENTEVLANIPETIEVSKNVLDNEKTIEDILGLVGKDGKIKWLAEMFDGIDEFKMSRQYILKYGSLKVTVSISAENEKS